MINAELRDVRNKIQRQQRAICQTYKRPESKEKNVRDSPYVSNYPSKASKRKSKEDRASKESLNKISKKKDYRVKSKHDCKQKFLNSNLGNSKRSKQDMLG